MLAPPIALKASGKVADAALCMTEHKVTSAASGAAWHGEEARRPLPPSCGSLCTRGPRKLSSQHLAPPEPLPRSSTACPSSTTSSSVWASW